MKFLIVTGFLLLSSFAFSSELPNKVKWKCGEMITATLNGLSIKLVEEWKKDSYNNSPPAFKSSTNNVGQWVSVEKEANFEKLVWLTPEKKVIYQFDTTSGCNPTITASLIKSGSRNVAADEWFNDRSLKELLVEKPNGIIFVWSPHMALSMKSIPELTSAASDIGLPITWLLDPQADRYLAQEKAEEHKLGKAALRRVDSMELSMRNALIHFPTLLVTKDGKICRGVQRGYREAKKFKAIIMDIFGACK